MKQVMHRLLQPPMTFVNEILTKLLPLILAHKPCHFIPPIANLPVVTHALSTLSSISKHATTLIYAKAGIILVKLPTIRGPLDITIFISLQSLMS